MADGGGAGEARLIGTPVYKDYVLDALADWRGQGLRTALVTLIGIDGGAPRPPGSQMAVAEDGRAVGAISGGCVEQALVLDALAAMARGENHVELYGRGARFRDIVLPCGSAIRVGFDVTLGDDALAALIRARELRREAVYGFEAGGLRFEKRYPPQPRLMIFGASPIVPFVAQMAVAAEFEVVIHSPDETVASSIDGARHYPLRTPGDWDASALDDHTAVLSLFHDHDFELPILETALRSGAFYIGALGSRRTHGLRRTALRERGWSEARLDRIHGPVGLDIGAKSPPEIAIAILAELIRTYRAFV